MVLKRIREIRESKMFQNRQKLTKNNLELENDFEFIIIFNDNCTFTF